MFAVELSKALRQMPGMFNIQAKFKLHYFDRSIIRTKWPSLNKNPLQRAGNLVMRIARGLIRARLKKRGKPSQPGRPPYYRTGAGGVGGGRGAYGGHTPPFKMIYSVPYLLGTSVIVGMVGFRNKTAAVPGLHEHGGHASRFVYSGGSQRRLKSGRWGKKKTTYKRRTVRYPQRPFMEPALLRARAVLPVMWRMSISRSF